MIILRFFILGNLTSLIYPPFFFLPLGFVIFPYLIKLLSIQLNEKSNLKYFSYGFSYGLGFLIIYLLWIYNPFLINEITRSYAFLSLLLPIFLSIFFGLVFIIYRYLKNPIHLILATPFVFTIIEFLISNFLYGFPWISNSLILSNNLFGFYIIKYLGTLTSSYLIILIFILPTFLFYKNLIFNRKIIFLSLTPFLFILAIPFFLIYSDNYSDKKKEINIDAYQILNPINNKDIKKINQNIINLINSSNSDYIIFAENNFPFLVDRDDLSSLSNLISKEKKIIIGATSLKDNDYYNSFILVENDQIQIFDKQILVPFGEFLPFRKYLKFMEFISGSVDFKNGNKERILITNDNIKVLPIICYEIIFEQIFNNINNKDIDILINITNDSWFGNKIGPYQHFYISRIKALVANKPLVRVSNNGISALIDSNGNIIKSTKLNQISNFNFKLSINKDMSYLNFHRLISIYLLFIFIVFILLTRKNI